VHYTMGGLWVDYNLMTTVPGLYALGECNFSDHGANRLGASALMQGLADGYFVIPYTVGNYLSGLGFDPVDSNHPNFEKTRSEVEDKIKTILKLQVKRTVDDINKKLGNIMWEYCGIARSAEGLTKDKGLIQLLKKEVWSDDTVLGENA